MKFQLERMQNLYKKNKNKMKRRKQKIQQIQQMPVHWINYRRDPRMCMRGRASNGVHLFHIGSEKVMSSRESISLQRILFIVNFLRLSNDIGIIVVSNFFDQFFNDKISTLQLNINFLRNIWDDSHDESLSEKKNENKLKKK